MSRSNALKASAAVAALLATAQPAFAEDASLQDLEARIAEQERELTEQRVLLERYQNAVQSQQRQLDALRNELQSAQAIGRTPGAGGTVQPATVRTPPPVAGGPQRVQQAGQQAPGQQAPVGAPPPDEDDRPDLLEIPIAAAQTGVLLPKGHAVIEPSFQYSQTQTSRAEVTGFTVLPAILIGSFEVGTFERQNFEASITGRYGITNRLEGEVRVPYIYADNTETTRPIGTAEDQDVTRDIGNGDLGDIEAALHYQINRGRNDWPVFVGNVRYKSNTGLSPFDIDVDANGNETEAATGSGFHAVEPSITAIYPSDPAVFFANAGYTFNIPGDEAIGEVDPGNVFGVNLGAGFALNEQVSLSIAYDHDWVKPTEIEGIEVNDDLQVGRLLFGGSFRLNDRVSISTTFGVGATEDAPDLTALLRVPIRMNLFGD